MFSVSLLYSAYDFLKLIPLSGMSPETFKIHFRTFKYSAANNILEVSFKCGWSQINQEGIIELTERGSEISKFDYKGALLFQLEDLISNYNPVWASALTKGRTEAKNFLPDDAFQCFKECGLFEQLSEDIIKYWDKLALAYRNYSHKKLLEIGRLGEKLSYDYELNRTGTHPIWQSVESNLAGFDLLSVSEKGDSKKLQIEVKSTISEIAYSKIHITKNEWLTATNSLNYIFHLWHITATPQLFIVTIDKVASHISEDKGDGNWESVQIPFKSIIS